MTTQQLGASGAGDSAVAAQLRVEDLNLSFGGVVALAGVSLAVAPGEIAAIIGPNGAGKTSLLNAISGLYQPQRGRIVFESESILGRNAHQIAGLGIARTFQNLGLFAGMTVLDNLLLGRHIHLNSGLLAVGQSVNFEQFQLGLSIQYLAMIVIGGLGSIPGALFGAVFITLLPIVLRNAVTVFGDVLPGNSAVLVSSAQFFLFGLVIVAFMVVEPQGLARLWRNVKDYFRLWPFSY